nr:hypothetical protein [Tanacetum cinerariifolium]
MAKNNYSTLHVMLLPVCSIYSTGDVCLSWGRARPVFRKHLPRIKGTRGSGSKSTTTKSAGKWNIPTFTLTSLAIPIGLETERSASSRVMQVGVNFGSDNSFHTESGMRFRLAPRSHWGCLFELGKVGRVCRRSWEWWRWAGKWGKWCYGGWRENRLRIKSRWYLNMGKMRQEFAFLALQLAFSSVFLALLTETAFDFATLPVFVTSWRRNKRILRVLESDSQSSTEKICIQLEPGIFADAVKAPKKALGINPKDSKNPFIPPPAGDLIMDFVNNLGYPEEIHFVSKMFMLWGVVTQTNVDYAELIWEEFIQAIKTFFADAANLKTSTKKPSKPHVIPYCRFTKLIICCLGHKHDIHRRPESPYHVRNDDFLLRNLKFIPKGKKDEVFGMAIPKDLITEAIQNSEYYDKYVEMAGKKKARKDDVPKQASKSKKPTPSKKQAPVKKLVPAKEKASKPSPSKKAHKGKMLKIHKGEESMHLVDKLHEENQPAHEPQVDKDELNLQRGIQMSLEAFKSQDAETSADTDRSNSKSATKILEVTEEQGDDGSNTVTLEARTTAQDEGQAGSDLGKQTPESWPPQNKDQTGPNPGLSHVALVGPDPEPVYEDFIAMVYPKNLDDVFIFGDRFIKDKSPEDEQRKATVVTKVKSMVTVPIHKASSSTPSLSTPVIDLATLKPVSPPTPAPITSTTATTTTLPLTPPPLQQGSPDSGLAAHNLGSRVFVLELRDLPHKIDQTVNEVVTEAIKIALQALLRESFRDLFKADMKEILYQWFFESGSYKAHPDHANLLQALEVSMDRDNMNELMKATTKSRKRCHDDQDPPPPPPKDSDQSKKKKA